jgi:hypothetical protein
VVDSVVGFIGVEAGGVAVAVRFGDILFGDNLFWGVGTCCVRTGKGRTAKTPTIRMTINAMPENFRVNFVDMFVGMMTNPFRREPARTENP